MGSHYAIADTISSVANQLDKLDAPGHITQAIKLAAAKTGVDFTYMMKKAAQESNFDPTATATTSSATGLYQFTSQTWLHMIKDYGAQYGLSDYASKITSDASGHLSVSDAATRKEILGLRKDPQLSAEMSAELDKENAAYLQKKVGGKIGATELYLAHFLGAYGAASLIKEARNNPDAAAADILPSAAAANNSVFYSKDGEARSARQVYQTFARKFDAGSSTTQVASANPLAGVSKATLSNAADVSGVAGFGLATGTSANTTMQVASLGQNLSNVALSGDATLFAAMVLGQMGGVGNETRTDAYTQQADTERRKGVASALSAIV